jgi:ATP-binding cassette subfamily B (MDR/TAP) protein 1
MSDSRGSTSDEKAAVNDEKGTTAHHDNSRKSFFSRRKSQLPVDEKDEDEKNGDVATEVTPAEREVPPISFTQLFRYPFFLPECPWILIFFQFFDTVRTLH